MVAQHYRWDFIGLSTDEKPTPQTSEKVVDGSTFYCSDNSKLYVFCGSQWYEKVVSGGGQYVLPIATDETLGGVKVGNNLSIDSETGVLSATDTTYSNFTGTDGTQAGTAGLVPAPATTDAGKFLKADGTWDTAGGGGVTPVQTTGTSTTDVMSQDAVTKMICPDIANVSTNPKLYIDPTGTTATVASAISIGFNNEPYITTEGYNIVVGADNKPKSTSASSVTIGNRNEGGTGSVMIGSNTASGTATRKIGIGSVIVGNTSQGLGSALQYITIVGTGTNVTKSYSVAIGEGATVTAQGGVALGVNAKVTALGGVSIGESAENAVTGTVEVGATNTTYGYNSSNYRKITGVYDGENLHDCATVAQANLLSTTAPTTSTVGVLGQLYTDTTNMHTYQCTAIDTTDPDNPSYTWTQRW